MRRAIARRMSESKQRVPHFYESVVVEMDAVIAALAEMNAARDPGDRVTVTAVLIHALAETLVEHPAFNAVWDGEDLIRWASVNIGVAIEVSDGLLAPALIGCERRDLVSIASGLRDLVARTHHRVELAAALANLAEELVVRPVPDQRLLDFAGPHWRCPHAAERH